MGSQNQTQRKSVGPRSGWASLCTEFCSGSQSHLESETYPCRSPRTVPCHPPLIKSTHPLLQPQLPSILLLLPLPCLECSSLRTPCGLLLSNVLVSIGFSQVTVCKTAAPSHTLSAILSIFSRLCSQMYFTYFVSCLPTPL